jgi:hypothetical protein
MGLLWMLQGERVVALTATGARLSGGLAFHRKGKMDAENRYEFVRVRKAAEGWRSAAMKCDDVADQVDEER